MIYKNNALNNVFRIFPSSEQYINIELSVDNKYPVMIKIITLSGKTKSIIVDNVLKEGIYTYTVNKKPYKKGIYIIYAKIGKNSYCKSLLL